MNEPSSEILQQKFVGEKAAVSLAMEPLTDEDFKRLTAIDTHLNTDDTVVGNFEMDREETVDWLTPREGHRVFVVTGSTNLSETKEMGNIQGWI